jgi:hypothetical protein
MKTKETMTICPVKYTPFTRIRMNRTVIHKIRRAIGPKAHKLRDDSPDVSPYQGLREGPSGDTVKREFKNKNVRSRNVYENKQTSDKVPEKSRTFST